MSNLAEKDDPTPRFNWKDLKKGATSGCLSPQILKILDSLPFYVLLIDKNHHILLANKATRDTLGLEPDEMIGQYCPKVVHGLESGTYPGCPLQEAVESGQGVEREHFDEETCRWLKVAVYPTGAWSVDGQEIYFHMIRDITEQKEAIRKLRENEERTALNFERERNISTSLQSMVLPDKPERDDVEVGLVYRSSDDYASVGGDFYDFLDLGYRKLAIALGDVSGRGLEAAKLTAMIKYTLRAFIAEEPDPGTCMAKINRALCRQLPEDKFVSLGLAVIDTAAKTVIYISAGHPLPVMLRNGRMNQILSPEHLPLGVMEQCEFRHTVIEGAENSYFLMFSDGLIEASSGGGTLFGRDHLHGYLESQSCCTAQEMADDLHHEAVRYAGRRLHDDFSLIVVRIP